jgi:enoyl-CoA hydratase/carnithine racemase
MPVTLRHDADTAVIVLDRPPLNALDPEMLEQLLRAIETVAAQPPAGGAVLTGAGRAFTAGVDTRVVAGADAGLRARMVLTINRLATALYALDAPLVAAFNGHAIGAGIVMGLASDRRIAARGDARFGLTEVTAGIPYPSAALEVVRAGLAEPHLSRLVLGGETLAPDAALATGMIDEIVEPADLLPRALAVARSLASAAAFAPVKRQLRAALRARLAAIVASGSDPLIDATPAR